MEKLNITRPHKYMKDGVEKTQWKEVGKVVIFDKADGTRSGLIELNHTSEEWKIFPLEAKGGKQSDPLGQAREALAPQDNSDMGLEDIPF